MDILAQNQSSNGIYAQFFMKAIENKAESREKGRPIFIEREYVKINIAGDNKTEVQRRATDEDKARFRPQYEAFKAGQDNPVVGTPLDQWPQLSVSKVAELKGLNIYTVEALAELPDTSISRLGMGGRELVKQAAAFIEAAAGGAPMTELIEKNSQLEDEVSMLKNQIKELSESIDKLKSE